MASMIARSAGCRRAIRDRFARGAAALATIVFAAAASAQQPPQQPPALPIVTWPAGVITGEQARAIARQKGWLVESHTDQRTIALHSIANGRPVYLTTMNRTSADTISTDEVWGGGSAGLALDGAGVRLGEWDAGDVRLTHQDFNVVRASDGDGGDGFGPNFHSTHVAGTMIGLGLDGPNQLAHGMASGARLVCYDWNFDLDEVPEATAGGIRASNHSYGYVTGWDYGAWNAAGDEGWYWWGDPSISQTEDANFGAYSIYTAAFDAMAASTPDNLMVWSAGNDRGEGPQPGALHFVYDVESGDWVTSTTARNKDGGTTGYDCISYMALCKNVLTVGAVLDLSGGYTAPAAVGMTSFSCWGPADDGRIKPDITANGYQLLSAWYDGNASYAAISGTSMAAPSVTGSLALLVQHYRNTHTGQGDLRGAALKGLVIHTADECGSADGPDYSFGWGLMNTKSAAAVITRDAAQPLTIQERTLNGGQTYELLAASDPAATQFKASICWFDPNFNVVTENPPLNSRSPTLVNNLDLRVIDAHGGAQNLPWTLNPNAPANAAVRVDNNVDNVEVVSVPLTPGVRKNFRIRVSHKANLRNGRQDYTLIITGAQFVAESECNSNGVIDAIDLVGGTSRDCNTNVAPDECDIRSQVAFDCDTNRTPDLCDLRLGVTGDCNTNFTPDPCDLRSPLFRDCDTNANIDLCDVRFGGAAVDCNTSNIPDACEADCNTNLQQDACESRDGGAAVDCNSNRVPDACEADCNTNGVQDICDLAAGNADCNTNGTLDACEIRAGTLADCNGNNLSDLCESDQDGDHAIDACDGCPLDGHKTAPGQCGCGTSDGDTDGDGLIDCQDGCPLDAAKTDPGPCGCGVAETDGDGDLTPDCNDGCPDDATRGGPGLCGCGTTPEQCARKLGCPLNVTINATAAEGGALYFAPPQQIGQPGHTQYNWSHASGSVFPVGHTTVTFTAHDDVTGEEASCSFVVTVKALPTPRGTGQITPDPGGGTGADGNPLGELCGMFGAGGAALQTMLCGGGLLLVRTRVRMRVRPRVRMRMRNGHRGG